MTDLAAIAAARARGPGGRGRRARARRPARRGQGRPRAACAPTSRSCPGASPRCSRRVAEAQARVAAATQARDAAAAQASAAQARPRPPRRPPPPRPTRRSSGRAGSDRTSSRRTAGTRRRRCSRGAASGCSTPSGAAIAAHQRGRGARSAADAFAAPLAAADAELQAAQARARRRVGAARRGRPPQLADARNRQAAVEALPGKLSADIAAQRTRVTTAWQPWDALLAAPRRDRARRRVAAATSPLRRRATAELERLRAELVAGDSPDDLAALVATDLPLALLPVRLETRFDAGHRPARAGLSRQRPRRHARAGADRGRARLGPQLPRARARRGRRPRRPRWRRGARWSTASARRARPGSPARRRPTPRRSAPPPGRARRARTSCPTAGSRSATAAASAASPCSAADRRHARARPRPQRRSARATRRRRSARRRSGSSTSTAPSSAGMALRIPLAAADAGGLDRLVVLGVRATADGTESARRLVGAARRPPLHRRARARCAPGTPTNNTESVRSAWTPAGDDPAVSLRNERGAALATSGSDGTLLARALGIAVDPLTPRRRRRRRRPSLVERQMRTALWPATWGYMLDQLAGELSDDAIAAARAHFLDDVTAGGALPALRLGRQPYGVLPVTSLRQWRLLDPPDLDAAARRRCCARSRPPGARRSTPCRASRPASTSATVLATAVAMSPVSLRYAARGLSLPAPDAATFARLRAGARAGPGARARRSTRRSPAPSSSRSSTPLTGPLVTDAAVGDRAAAGGRRTTSPGSSTAASTTVRTGAPPGGANTLLFALLRHALLRAYATAALRIVRARGLAAPGEGTEPGLGDGTRADAVGASRRAAGRRDRGRADARPRTSTRVRAANSAAGSPAAAQLDRAARAARRPAPAASSVPTAALARLAGGVLDLASHRLDAWVSAHGHAPARRAAHAQGRSASGSAATACSRTCAPRRPRRRRATATSTRRRSGRRRPRPSCAPGTWPSAAGPTRRSRSTSPRGACGSRSRCSTASAPASRSARCSATGSSAACTSTIPGSRSTATSRRCAALAPLDAITAAEHDLRVATDRQHAAAQVLGQLRAAAATRRRRPTRRCCAQIAAAAARSSTPRRRNADHAERAACSRRRRELAVPATTHRPGGFPAILGVARRRSPPRRRRIASLEPQVAAANQARRQPRDEPERAARPAAGQRGAGHRARPAGHRPARGASTPRTPPSPPPRPCWTSCAPASRACRRRCGRATSSTGSGCAGAGARASPRRAGTTRRSRSATRRAAGALAARTARRSTPSCARSTTPSTRSPTCWSPRASTSSCRATRSAPARRSTRSRAATRSRPTSRSCARRAPAPRSPTGCSCSPTRPRPPPAGRPTPTQVRAKVEPALEAWAASVLGPASRVLVRVRVRRRRPSDDRPQRAQAVGARRARDDAGRRARRRDRDRAGAARPLRRVRPGADDASWSLERDPAWTPAQLGLAEFLELARAVRELLDGARPLDARDLALPGAATDPGIDAADLAARDGDRHRRAAPTRARSWRRRSPAGSPARCAPRSRARPSSASRRRRQRRACCASSTAAPRPSRRPTTDTRARRRRARRRLPPAAARDGGRGGELVASLAASTELQGGDPLAAVTWLQRAAHVRDGASRLETALLYAEATGSPQPLRLRVAQLPRARRRPLGRAARDRAAADPSGRLSLVVQSAAAPRRRARRSPGSWSTSGPRSSRTATQLTGVSFHVDQPAARAPQAILLAVAPDRGARLEPRRRSRRPCSRRSTSRGCAWSTPRRSRADRRAPAAVPRLGHYLPGDLPRRRAGRGHRDHRPRAGGRS